MSILEFNSEPAIEMTGPRLTWILEDLFIGIAKVCVAPFFHEANKVVEETQGKLGETKEHLTKCLDIQVRGADGWRRG